MGKNILCIGAGYVGGTTMAVMADKCPEHRVVSVDINEERIKAWNSDNLPIYEPGLEDVVKRCRGRNLFFSTNVGEEIAKADIIFVSVNTPTKTFGIGAGKAADLQYWEKTARDIVRHSTSGKIIVEKTTLPVRTAHAMEKILHSNDKGIHFEVVSNPEFLAEGTAINDLMNPDRILIGTHENKTGIQARKEMVELYAHWIPKKRIVTSNLWSSELSKLVANAFLAQRVSSINSISALCEKTDADISEISKAIGMDSRIGKRFLNASIGFGGSCFKKDILNLVYLCEFYGLKEVADYWNSVININEYQEIRFVGRMVHEMFRTLAGKKIALFGYAFKADTGDTRETPAYYVTKELLDEHAMVHITDPKALENADDHFGSNDGVILEPDPYKAAEGAHAIAIMTEWEQYKDLDFERIFKSMEKPAFLFDGRNLLDHKKLYKMGFNVFPIGKKSLKHF